MSDLYAYISYHHWEGSANRRYGIGIDQVIPKSMEGFRSAMLEKNTSRSIPEMKRTIAAFVFIYVDAASQMENH